MLASPSRTCYRNAVDTTAAWRYQGAMHSVLELPTFTRRADALLTRDERDALIDFLAGVPKGDTVAGAAGVQKVRWAPAGRGKRGAYRVIYYVATENLPILAIFLYGKDEQPDLTPDQKKAIGNAVRTIKENWR